MQLRLLVETAAKALLVDHDVKFRADVFTGVEELERSFRREEPGSARAASTSKVLGKLSKLVGQEVAEEAVRLWNKLSGVGSLQRILQQNKGSAREVRRSTIVQVAASAFERR